MSFSSESVKPGSRAIPYVMFTNEDAPLSTDRLNMENDSWYTQLKQNELKNADSNLLKYEEDDDGTDWSTQKNNNSSSSGIKSSNINEKRNRNEYKVKRVIFPLIAASESAFTRASFQGLIAFPGFESSLLGKRCDPKSTCKTVGKEKKSNSSSPFMTTTTTKTKTLTITKDQGEVLQNEEEENNNNSNKNNRKISNNNGKANILKNKSNNAVNFALTSELAYSQSNDSSETGEGEQLMLSSENPHFRHSHKEDRKTKRRIKSNMNEEEEDDDDDDDEQSEEEEEQEKLVSLEMYENEELHLEHTESTRIVNSLKQNERPMNALSELLKSEEEEQEEEKEKKEQEEQERNKEPKFAKEQHECNKKVNFYNKVIEECKRSMHVSQSNVKRIDALRCNANRSVNDNLTTPLNNKRVANEQRHLPYTQLTDFTSDNFFTPASLVGNSTPLSSLVVREIDGGIRNHWGVHLTTPASLCYRDYVLQSKQYFSCHHNNNDSSNDSNNNNINNNNNNINNIEVANVTESKKVDTSKTNVPLSQNTKLAPLQKRIDKRTEINTQSTTSVNDIITTTTTQHMNAASEVHLQSIPIGSAEMDDAMRNEANNGTTDLENIYFAPISTPPLTQLNAQHSCNEEIIEDEEEYEVWSSNHICCMPIFQFPQLTSFVLVQLVEYLVRRSAMELNEFETIDICKDVLGPPETVKDLSPEARKQMIHRAKRLLLAASFLQM